MKTGRTRRLRLLLCFYFVAMSWIVPESATAAVGKTACREVRVEVERLPDLNIPRAGHSVFFDNGEVVVVGGHTSGFVPTPTAEYFKDGKWNLLQTVYEHDDGFAVQLKSGKMLLAGGHAQHLGIGQTFVAELYDPENHVFKGFGCLGKKRSLAQGMALGDGRVVIAGNWYLDDAIEVFVGKNTFVVAKEIPMGMARPFIFPISADDAVVFSSVDTVGQHRQHTVVWRLNGESFSVPLFDEWYPVGLLDEHNDELSFVGDTAKGIYAYLFPVMNAEGQMAIARMQADKDHSEPQFSLLSTECSVPMESQWGPISYFSTVVVDNKSGRGFVMGIGKDNRYYVLSIDKVHAQADVPLTLYYTDPLDSAGYAPPVITPEGNIIIAGGLIDSNFTPFSSAYLLCLGSPDAILSASSRVWPWVILAVLALLAALIFWFHKRRRKQVVSLPLPEEPEPASDESEKNLIQRICSLMDERQLYLRSDLKLSDISALLGTNGRYVSEAIKNQRGCSFTQFINGYRVEFAKEMLRSQPDRKMTEVITASGFSGESSFFRTFKSFTGLTPGEWIAQEQGMN